jgi:serine/threonine-protein kinase
VYLCDFGLGRDLEIATAQQMRDGAGTPMYMAPERLLRATADEVRCDIYSMGVTLFEALTLQRPFEVPVHVTLASLPAFLAGAEPRRPGAVRPGFPRDLEAVIMKAMAHDPAHRHESTYELAADLDRLSARKLSRSIRRLSREGHRPHDRTPHNRSGRARDVIRGARATAEILDPGLGPSPGPLTDPSAG